MLEPEPTEEKNETTKSRFAMPALPQLTIVQMVLVAFLVIHGLGPSLRVR